MFTDVNVYEKYLDSNQIVSWMNCDMPQTMDIFHRAATSGKENSGVSEWQARRVCMGATGVGMFFEK